MQGRNTKMKPSFYQSNHQSKRKSKRWCWNWFWALSEHNHSTGSFTSHSPYTRTYVSLPTTSTNMLSTTRVIIYLFNSRFLVPALRLVLVLLRCHHMNADFSQLKLVQHTNTIAVCKRDYLVRCIRLQPPAAGASGHPSPQMNVWFYVRVDKYAYTYKYACKLMRVAYSLGNNKIF